MAERVILTLLSEADPSADGLTRVGKQARVAWSSARDLSVAGWKFDPSRPDEGIAMTSEGPLPMRRVAGVLVRRPWVSPGELGHIAREDRPYVAAEMTAFLLAWLAAAACPVINRPTPMSLCGPGWRRMQWMCQSFRLGVAPDPEWQLQYGSRPDEDALDNPDVAHLTVLGEQVFGNADANLARHALRLAKSAGTELLGVVYRCFDGDWRCCAADPTPSIDVPVAKAIFARCGVLNS